MNELKGPPAEVRFTITVTRAKTGKTETYEMVGSQPQETPVTSATDNEQPKEQ